jgi:hypothetical protein
MQFINTPAGRLQVEEPVLPTSPVKFSRLYGYRGIQPVPGEQEVIHHVVTTIATSPEPIEEVIGKLVQDLNDKGVKRGEKRWIRSTVRGLVRPIFGGRVETADGFVVSEFYPAAVEWSMVQLAISRLK